MSSKPKQGYKRVSNFFRHSFEIPDDWDYPKFHEVVKINPVTKINEDLVPYIPMNAVDVSKPHFNYFDERALSENSSLAKFQENDILFARITPSTENGKTCIVENFPKKGIVSSELIVLRPTTSIFPKYLYYYVKSERIRQFYISQMLGSTGRQRVPNYVFKKDLSFELPPFSEQRKIATIISNVDDLVELYDKKITHTKHLKQSLLKQLFTKGIGHKKFKKSPIGEIPIEWSVKKLNEIAKIERGKFTHRPRNDPEYYGGKYPFIQTGDVESSNGRITKFSQTLNELGLSVSKLFPKNIIVITIAANIGSTAITTFPVCFPDSLIAISAKRVNLVFLEYFLRTKKEHLNNISINSTQKNINLETLKPLLIPIPNEKEQDNISKILQNLDFIEYGEKSKRNYHEKIKKGLMQKLLTGQIRV